MENTISNTVKETISAILEQIKIVLILYGIIAVIHIISVGSKLTDLAKSSTISFTMVILAIILKNLIKKPNLPGFAWATLVSFVFTLPVSPVSDFIINGMSSFSFGLVGLPLLAFAGISVGDQLEVFKKLSWKIVIISFIVMTSTYFASAGISNIVLSLKDML